MRSVSVPPGTNSITMKRPVSVVSMPWIPAMPRMVQLGEESRFAVETSQALRVGGERLGQQLDGDLAAERRVTGTVDLPHRACTQRRDDFVRRQACTGGEIHSRERTNPGALPSPSSACPVRARARPGGKISSAFGYSCSHASARIGCRHTVSAESRRNQHLKAMIVAEGEGFEPPVGLTLRRFSKPVPSTAWLSLRAADPGHLSVTEAIAWRPAHQRLRGIRPLRSLADVEGTDVRAGWRRLAELSVSTGPRPDRIAALARRALAHGVRDETLVEF